MRLFRRDHTPSADELGGGTALTVDVIGGQFVSAMTWTREVRRVLDRAQPALTVLRRAGVAGSVHLRPGPVAHAVEGEIRLRAGGVLGVVVDENGHGFRLVPDRGSTDPVATDDIEVGPGISPQDALGDVVFAVASLVADTEEPPVTLPAPLTVTGANLQHLRATADLPARWCACVFVTRAHDVPDDADQEERTALWVEHSVGIKLHLDGSIAADPDDVDPHGESSRQSLATATTWAGVDVDLVPYARWLADRTQEVLRMRVPGL
ncbi:hypothetical protein [Cellulomonas phragmiteti]|uniref:Uncharacterized protein n=1 Tax=Cellulomonas phragmiteti TaxID=478780 RepID=A0ABQ4DS20_9CELL|nr:hypothetical protein [Cellulomonas phragmiteti]GIG41751.1 hypothetical protein Cph01nite_35130 [Cellulomonas phragmiteti]